MSIATFKVRGRLGFAGGERVGTVSIDRESGKVTVRPKGSRTVYETSLNRLADHVCATSPGSRAAPSGDDGGDE